MTAMAGAKANLGPQTQPSETGVDNLLNLLRRELIAPLARLTQLAGRLEELRTNGYLPATLSGEQTFAELADTAHYSMAITDRLIKLGDVLVGPPIVCDERILIAETLHDVAQDLQETARKRGIGIRMEATHEMLAPVYGSKHWLCLALRLLISPLITSSGAGMHVLMKLRQVGFHQLISGTINYHRTSQTTQDLLPAGRGPHRNQIATAIRVDQLDLVLAHTVIELHGGTLKTVLGESGIPNEFHLSLPTGEPQAIYGHKDCSSCQHMRQAEQFAQDIGELLNNKHAKHELHTNGHTS